MKKKLIIIFLFILFLVIVGVTIFEKQYGERHVSVGNSNFEIPNNFHQGKNYKYDIINLTNGEHSILLYSYNQGNLKEQIKGLENYMDNVSEPYNTTNFTTSNTNIYKLTVLNNTENHYWFEKNNDVYYIYNWDGLEDMDQIVSNFVKTMSP